LPMAAYPQTMTATAMIHCGAGAPRAPPVINPFENDSREAPAWIMCLLDGRMRQLMIVRSK
jgi:hypothetical protein